MSVDKLVDSTQLDSDLTSVANAIRTKGGTSADLVFPGGFVDAIEAISGGGGGTHNLPSGYTEYEYIEATGTQYINTGYVLTENSEIVLTSMRTASQSYNSCEFGVQPTPRFVLAGIYGNWGSATDKSSNAKYNPDSVYGKKVVKINKNGIYDLNNTLAVSFGSPTWTSGSLPLYVLARNNNGTVERNLKAKLYEFIIYENGVKTMELIPAMRNSDSVLGLYDTVSDTFFTNAGTGAFTGGAY